MYCTVLSTGLLYLNCNIRKNTEQNEQSNVICTLYSIVCTEYSSVLSAVYSTLYMLYSSTTTVC